MDWQTILGRVSEALVIGAIIYLIVKVKRMED